MARLNTPDDFPAQLTLLANIVSENNSEGAKSPLTAFLTQQNIVLDDDVAAGNTAQTHETNRAKFSRQSENFRQLRDNYFMQPWSHITGIAQYLKSFYKGNSRELGNWGIPILDGGRIVYPAAFADRVTVFTDVVAKQNSFDGGSSPLTPYLLQHNINLADDTTLVQQAQQNDAGFTTMRQQSENETQLRNQIWEPVLAHIRDIGNFLMKLYSNNPKALGAWGFEVDDSPKQPALRTTKLKAGEQRFISGAVIGSTLTNAGKTQLLIYKGRAQLDTPATLEPGGVLAITKGHSIFTVVNASAVEDGCFRVMTHR